MRAAQILVICDDTSLMSLLRYFFTEHGFAVDVVQESEAGLEWCRRAVPEIILIRYSTLGAPPDALTLCRRLRNDMAERTPPIFMISALQQEALRAGATEWFSFVFDLADLDKKVRAYLGYGNDSGTVEPFPRGTVS